MLHMQSTILTILEEKHRVSHGEKVASGTFCQLVFENAARESG